MDNIGGFPSYSSGKVNFFFHLFSQLHFLLQKKNIFQLNFLDIQKKVCTLFTFVSF